MQYYINFAIANVTHDKFDEHFMKIFLQWAKCFNSFKGNATITSKSEHISSIDVNVTDHFTELARKFSIPYQF